MNVTRDVISDLYPLYAENECSADSRTLVEEYLAGNPQDAAELQQIVTATLPRKVQSSSDVNEVRSLREARRRIQIRSWSLGLAIFFSLAPFSFVHEDGKTHWLFRNSPTAAVVYGAFAVVAWVVYVVMRNRSKIL